MKVVQINATCGSGSTGKICVEISRLLSDNGIKNYILYAVGESSEENAVRYADTREIKLASALSHLLGNYGFTSGHITKRLIDILDKIRPDVVHIHNIHSHNCHLTLLMRYLAERGIKVLWTFHDCWAFTGYCTHFMMTGCDKWMTECCSCPQYKHYSMLFDKSSYLFRKKKELFFDLDLTIITPSAWLAGVVKRSFFHDCPVSVIHNGIDLRVFKPLQSDIRDRYGIGQDCFMILGIAYDWSTRKGIDVFSQLAGRLNSDRYRIVLVGLDNGSRFGLPDRVITIPRIGNPQELARLYSAADVFVNPTREDNYPTVNMEAVACGTPVITFDVGGCAETIGEGTGIPVPVDDVDGMIRAVEEIESSRLYTSERCRKYAEDHFDRCSAFQRYLSWYLQTEAANDVLHNDNRKKSLN